MQLHEDTAGPGRDHPPRARGARPCSAAQARRRTAPRRQPRAAPACLQCQGAGAFLCKTPAGTVRAGAFGSGGDNFWPEGQTRCHKTCWGAHQAPLRRRWGPWRRTATPSKHFARFGSFRSLAGWHRVAARPAPCAQYWHRQQEQGNFVRSRVPRYGEIKYKFHSRTLKSEYFDRLSLSAYVYAFSLREKRARIGSGIYSHIKG